ncbi:hypothetical protein AVEN_123099-1 [Araneus ventricosus]|uniref:Uncharacterized protein n=1 Tax=Araneus ventricosus TaxID=182803 RepID=A0A4Y2K8M7_ARAVE|nr:hypothetical protein AVEN_123099-1 [Araneus ventricosus]
MTARQLLQQRSSPNSKPVTHFTARKVYDHFIAQSLLVPAHHQSGQQSAHMHTAHRFLDIQIISNKLGVAPVARRVTPSYSDVDSRFPRRPRLPKKWFKAKRVAGEKGHPKSTPKEQRAPAQRARFIGSNQVSYKHCP